MPKDATRTRMGVGDQFFDHAAGNPLGARQSFPGIPAPAEEPQYAEGAAGSRTRRHYVVAPVLPDDWADQPSLHDRQRLQEVLHANDAPVVLPLRSRASVYLVVAGILAGFIAIFAATLFAGITSTVNVPEKPAAPAPAGPVVHGGP